MVLVDPSGFPEPVFDSPPFTSASFGHYLAPGKYFLCDLATSPTDSNPLSDLTVCRILSVDNVLSKVKVNVFERGTKFCFDHPSTDLLDSNVTQLEEVYQSSTTLNLLSVNIILPAFVLSQKELVDRPRIPPLVGMASIFLLRYRIDGSYVPPGLCLSFPSLYDQCPLKSTFTQGCFNDMLTLRLSVNASIRRVGLRQGSFCRTYVKCSLQPSSWQYILKFISGKIGPPITNVRGYRIAIVEPGLVMTSAKLTDSRPIHRFETTSELEVLTDLIGKMTLVHPRKHYSKGQDLPLEPNDNLNVIPPSRHRDRDERANTRRYGIDLKWSEKESVLYIATRYCRFIYKKLGSTDYPDPASNDFSHRPELDIASLTRYLSCLITNENLSPVSLNSIAPHALVAKEGLNFDFNEKEYAIDSINEERGICICKITYATDRRCLGERFEFNTNLVLTLVGNKLYD
jgi:hypothetical protein